ncbi:GNAT family N-acetyltransferase [Paenibacillus woosongensis]|uniref:GNAT family N-acetyltransferase n=1 Tax=Paenibacillus woosongensis TaxID=307580 RepID=A0A7X3CQ77_9BACL|nr:GNAT family N-acetyltransferase [Paenibacillus woosongensis]MUG47639.1 GNAT family N-acetyltransferase [Paenibacillus woosongensis]
MEIYYNEFLISDHKERLDINVIKGYLARSYWANQRSADRIEKSIDNSVCFGIYKGSVQVGFARVVTDDATMYWLCDVFIDEDYRGQGLGKKLVEAITESERFRNLMGLLGTRDAHELYEQFHFIRDHDRFMRRAPR